MGYLPLSGICLPEFIYSYIYSSTGNLLYRLFREYLLLFAGDNSVFAVFNKNSVVDNKDSVVFNKNSVVYHKDNFVDKMNDFVYRKNYFVDKMNDFVYHKNDFVDKINDFVDKINDFVDKINDFVDKINDLVHRKNDVYTQKTFRYTVLSVINALGMTGNFAAFPVVAQLSLTSE